MTSHDAFRDYATALLADASQHSDADHIEIETVFPKWPPHIVVVDSSSRDVPIDFGTPLLEDVSATEKRLIPRPLDGLDTLPTSHKHWADGIRVFIHGDMPRQEFLPYLRDIDKPVNRHAPKVFTAVRNEVASSADGPGDSHRDVYHLFPNLTQPALMLRLCKTYAHLAHSSEKRVPNYILSAVRKRGHDPQDAPPDAYAEVMESLVKKARGLEKELEQSRLLMHAFDLPAFKRIYRRFRFLAQQPASGVERLGSQMSVDVADIRTTSEDGDAPATTPHKTTRLTLNGQQVFDRYCTLFKKLRTPAEIATHLVQTPDADCELMQKSELRAKDLPTLSPDRFPTRDRCYNGFKVNAKREEPVDKSTSAAMLEAFVTTKHSYRFKQRQSFRCGRFRVDLTLVRQATDDHRTFKPTPFVALQKLPGVDETYELEIERVAHRPRGDGPNADREDALQLMRLMDECLHAIHSHTRYFGERADLRSYPMLIDEERVRRVTQRFNQKACHPMRVHDFPPGALRIKTNTSPNVANMTHATLDYVRHHWEDYRLLVKTDGLHCIGFVDRETAALYLYTNKALSWMAFPLTEPPADDYVLDGEFYFHGANDGEGATDATPCTFFVFDVYCKGAAQLLTEPLAARLQAFDPADLRLATGSLLVRKKRPLDVTTYQSLRDRTELEPDERDELEAFECRDANGAKPQDDGFIVMHAGPLVRADVRTPEEETRALQSTGGVKPYVMRLDEFEQKGQGLTDESRRTDPYVTCLKWKPEEECTIDFQVRLDPHDTTTDAAQRRAVLCSKYNNPKTLVNLYTFLRALSSGSEDSRTPVVPRLRTTRTSGGHHVALHAFQPAEAYDYELGGSPIAGGVLLPCDPRTGAVRTEADEVVPDTSIVEMRYTRATQRWTPTRVRTDKQDDPNTYSVALANWKNIFHPVPPPHRWVSAPREAFDPTSMRAYYGERGGGGKTNLVDRIHLLLKQFLILRVSKLYADEDPRKHLKVFEMGCGRGTDLFHWNYVHEHIRPIRFYLGTDYDAQWLVCESGAVESYLHGGRTGSACGLDTRYTFDAVYAQADSGASLRDCQEHPWSARPRERPVSAHKLHYQLLRHVLYGIAPEEPALVEALSSRLVHPSYGLVSTQMAMHHFAEPRGAFWNNLYQVLDADGYLLATVPNGDFLREKVEAAKDHTYRVRVRVTEHMQRRKRGGSRTAPRVTHSEQDWYVYERVSATHVRFHTPKINPSVEPLFFRANLEKAIGKRFDVVYMGTFGDFADAHGLSIYDTVCNPFHAASINPDTLQHDVRGSHAQRVEPVHDTDAAREYSRSHYVVVLGKRGRTAGELERVRRALGGGKA